MSELSESDAMSEGGSWGSSSVLEPVSSDFDGVSFLLTFRFLLALWISRTIGCPRMGEGSRAKADKMSICLYQRLPIRDLLYASSLQFSSFLFLSV